uniref:Uncharacterized protein n=1 Tax=uncultured Thiotrichaceae bacterium TaxID=298394 RepID=A0A6S6TYN3_9GAMM|nr:MAG: Unknown protein [uncultured Thiotrichaceae bacterium]
MAMMIKNNRTLTTMGESHSQIWKSLSSTVIILCLVSCLFAGCRVAADTLAERGEHVLTQADINNMIATGEQIAAQSFTPEEKRQLKSWAVALFKQEDNIEGVVSAFDKYESHLKQAAGYSDPALRKMVWYQLYHEMLFQWQFPRYQHQQLTLLDVIQKYNPTLKQSVEQQIIAGVLTHQMQLNLNQKIFNRAMQIYREHGDNISQSISDLSTIRSLQISGNKVLETHPGYFLVKDKKGVRYKVTR